MENKVYGGVDLLAFGDSLTEGFIGWGDFHPYSIRLQQLLLEHFSDPSKVMVSQFGISGETVPEMVYRLPGILKEKESIRAKYSHVVILGGTNDLGNQRKTPQSILEKIINLHTMSWEHGAFTVAVTIPEGFFREEWYINRRKEINDGLKNWASENKEKVLLLDLEKSIPHLGLSKEEKAKMWCDSLHFSAAGYDRFGELVFEALKSHWVKQLL